jgi:hypothetical protein
MNDSFAIHMSLSVSLFVCVCVTCVHFFLVSFTAFLVLLLRHLESPAMLLKVGVAMARVILQCHAHAIVSRRAN